MRRACLTFLAGVMLLAGGPATANALTQPELQELAAEAHARIAARIGVPFTPAIVVEIDDAKPPAEEAGTAAYADPAKSNETVCRVVFTPVGAKEKLTESRTEMLHELTHCLEFQLNHGTSPVPDWVSEGGATYVGARLGAEWNGAAKDENIEGFWKWYLEDPAVSLLERKYTAMPFFVGLENADVDVLKLIPQLFAAADPEAENYDQALAAAVGSSGDRFLRTLAPSLVRRPALGGDWALKGPSLPPAKVRMPTPVKVVKKDKPVTVTAPAYGARGAVIKASGGKVLIVEVGDPETTKGLFHTADEDTLESGAYCLKGSCACAGGDDALRKLGNQATLAVYGDAKAGKVTFRISDDVKDACPKSGTALNVSGAVGVSLTEDGHCSTFRLGDDDIQVIFFQVIGGQTYQLTLELDTLGGPGAYPAPPSGVTLATGGSAYGTFVRNEPPAYPASGVINVASITAGRMKGTVSATMRAAGQEVSVTGAWSCKRP